MNAISIIIGLAGLAIGLIIGYKIYKGKADKRINELQTQFEKERQISSEIQNDLNKISKDLQNTQNEKIRFETQFTGTDEQLKIQKIEHEKLKEQLLAVNQNILRTESQKTKAETELTEARNLIVKLNKDIEEYKRQTSTLQEQITEIKTTNADLSAKYQESLKAIEDQKKFVSDSSTNLREAFKSLSSDVLKSNNESFLQMAAPVLEKHINLSKTDMEKRQQAIDSMVKPLGENLTKLDGKIQEIEKIRQGAYSEVKIMVENMKGTTDKLQQETNTLVTALKTSHVRGKYGEIGLRRVVEFAGMSEFCDFEEQSSVMTEDGRLRPDLIVKLPGERRIIIDAKVPLDSYMAAFETTDESEKKNFFNKHAIAVRNHLKKLSEKAYWSQFEDSPDYVIMYLQIESSFGAALEFDRTIIEDGMNNKVIFATPTTLIAMLRTIAFSWQQVKIADNIYQIRDAGVELYNRVTTLIQHIGAVGNSLTSATQNYNKAVGSLESRFIPQVKKLKEIGGTLMDKEIPEINRIETSLRPLNEPPLMANNSEQEDDAI